jgi:hypothetical protein
MTKTAVRKPKSKTTIVDIMAPFNRVILNVLAKDWDQVPQEFDVTRGFCQDHMHQRGSRSNVARRVLAGDQTDKPIVNCTINVSSIVDALVRFSDFKDANVMEPKMNDFNQIQIRTSMRRRDPDNSVKANYLLDDPRFIALMKTLEGHQGKLIITMFDDVYAKQTGEKVLHIELRNARRAKGEPEAHLVMSNDGLELFCF